MDGPRGTISIGHIRNAKDSLSSFLNGLPLIEVSSVVMVVGVLSKEVLCDFPDYPKPFILEVRTPPRHRPTLATN